METMINPPRMTWKGKLLRLLHIKRKTVCLRLPVVVPINDFPAVDDPPSEHVDFPEVDNPPSLPRESILGKFPAELPYDIILDIFSRLPVECILECQRVSRPLQVLTTTPLFSHMHRQRFNPVIVVQLSSEESSEFIKLYYMDKNFERIEEKFTGSSLIDSSLYKPPVCTPLDPNFLLGSCDGFLTFANIVGLPRTFYMWNPITGEQLAITDRKMIVCGLYFNRDTKDHELLYYAIDKRARSGKYCRFSAYSLRNKIKRDVGSFAYPPSRERPPVIIRGILYWVIDRPYYYWLNTEVPPPFSDSIMSFDTKTEEFSTLEPGGRRYSTTGGEYSKEMWRIEQLHLSRIDGELCLCDFLRFDQLLLSIFNQATQCWSTREILILPEYRDYLIHEWPNRFTAEVVEINDNELLVRQGRRLLLYNMLSHDCKISEVMGCVDKSIRVTVHTHRIDSFHM